ncbi:MAG: Asp-tRNA(Asn)/Glu-tRNA(Gln) amidotransferase subunit GatC [Actinomycetota bacterium]|nr:Asp-tRNA(Asn)/Glu-tRNA(Gln) amidotransferase subunit GatC [Actinomycetota bacterium]
MIDRDQVLHVASLARLALSEEEIDKMASELSDVLDHIEKIRELDLDGVQPTTHVVDLVNALRSDEPEPSLPVEAVLATAPEPVVTPNAREPSNVAGSLTAVMTGFGVPSPVAA